jgi:hypothetical protein
MKPLEISSTHHDQTFTRAERKTIAKFLQTVEGHSIGGCYCKTCKKRRSYIFANAQQMPRLMICLVCFNDPGQQIKD